MLTTTNYFILLNNLLGESPFVYTYSKLIGLVVISNLISLSK